jgi:hypothetical protein
MKSRLAWILWIEVEGDVPPDDISARAGFSIGVLEAPVGTVKSEV